MPCSAPGSERVTAGRWRASSSPAGSERRAGAKAGRNPKTEIRIRQLTFHVSRFTSAVSLSDFGSRISDFLRFSGFGFRLSAPAFLLLHWAACSLGILTRQNPFMRKWNVSSASFASSISLRS